MNPTAPGTGIDFNLLRARGSEGLPPRGNFLDFNGGGSVILMQVFCALVRRLFDIVSVVILYYVFGNRLDM